MISRRMSARETWPSLVVSVELAPWAWRLSWWRDDVAPRCWELNLGPVAVRCVANRPMFGEAS